MAEFYRKQSEHEEHELLLELYLNTWSKEKDDLSRNMYAEQIMKLLSQPGKKFDLDKALILCRNNRFDEGLIYLYSHAKLHNLILQYHIDQDDSLRIIRVCEEFGSEDPRLFMPALVHYSKTGDERLSQLLKMIELQRVIPPMVVIDVLLKSKRTNLGSIKDYIVRFMSKLNDRCIDNENALDHHKSTEIVRQKIEEFENHQTVFQPLKCSECRDILDLPSIHFLCKHSYHQECFLNHCAENDACPICVVSNKKLLDEIESHETRKSTMNQLDEQFTMPCDDAFNSVAKLFGYGLFN